MKQLIPLKKDIIFKTKIYEITNINLEHDYKVLDDIIEGNVYLSGTYKMTEASIIEEDFNYKIPFSIAISKRIKKDSIKIEIEDFKYSNEKDILKSDISLELTCDEEEVLEEEKEEYSDLDEYMDNYFEDEEPSINNIIIDNDTTNVIEDNITNNINMENNYYTYQIYIVRENDTIETICNKYNISIEELKKYNDINNINIGDKILIPKINE